MLGPEYKGLRLLVDCSHIIEQDENMQLDRLLLTYSSTAASFIVMKSRLEEATSIYSTSILWFAGFFFFKVRFGSKLSGFIWTGIGGTHCNSPNTQ